MYLICEKGSSNILKTNFNFSSRLWREIAPKLSFLGPFLVIVKGIIFGVQLLEYVIDSNLKARLSWLVSFSYWTFSTLLFYYKLIFLSQIFMLLAITFCFLGMSFFLRMQTIDFTHLDESIPEKFLFLIFISLFVIITFLTQTISLQLLLLISLYLFLIRISSRRRRAHL